MTFPKPHVMTLNNKTKLVRPISFKFIGFDKCVLDAVNTVFDGVRTEDNAAVSVSFKYDESRRLTYIENAHRVTDEKYLLEIKEHNGGADIVLSSSGVKGAFYGLCSVIRMTDTGSFFSGVIEDWPSFSMRGYIEGFYGKPWSFEQRADILKLMAKNGMNTYYYAPKDDEYHRKLWHEPYPDKELAELEKLAVLARSLYIDFNYCIAPGLSVTYSSDADFEALMSKIRQLYSVGVRSFGLLLDDIPKNLRPADAAVYHDTVAAHIDYVRRCYDAIKAIDGSNRLTVCPMCYCGRCDEYYISKLGLNIPSDVLLFWTGRDICSRELTVDEAVDFFGSTKHRPLYWDNYPVNDMEMFNEMHLGAVCGRDAELYKYSSGLIANCMEYCECSKIPLLTIADYLWNSEAYDAQRSWDNALHCVIGDDGELFKLFADNELTSCLYQKTENSGLLNEIISESEQGNREKFEQYVQDINACVKLMKSGTKPIFAELGMWAKKFYIFSDILNLLVSGNYEKVQLKNLIDQYNANPKLLVNVNLEIMINDLM